MLYKREHDFPAEAQYPGSNRAFLLRQQLAGRKKTNACTMQSKDITDIGNETASYKVLPLGNNVQSMDSICLLICYPSHLSVPLAF
jgi:hypothetical protein